MNLDEYIEDLRPTLTGYCILEQLFPKHATVETPYPPAELSEQEIKVLRERIDEAMPKFSMMVDLWDWDIHFEKDLSDDWYYEAVFGRQSSVNVLAEELAEYFLEQVDEFAMDYDQDNDPEIFHDLVMTEARQFIVNWRKNIQDQIAQNIRWSFRFARSG